MDLWARGQGLELYRQERGAEPDMVVLNSNSWDIAQLRFSEEGRAILEHEELPQSWLQRWIATADSLFRVLKVNYSPSCFFSNSLKTARPQARAGLDSFMVAFGLPSRFRSVPQRAGLCIVVN